jgi:hypothetical protein
VEIASSAGGFPVLSIQLNHEQGSSSNYVPDKWMDERAEKLTGNHE